MILRHDLAAPKIQFNEISPNEYRATILVFCNTKKIGAYGVRYHFVI